MPFEFVYACGKCKHEQTVCFHYFAVGPLSGAPERAFRALMTYEPSFTDRILFRTSGKRRQLVASFDAAHEIAGNILHRLQCPYCFIRVTVPQRVTAPDLQRWQELHAKKIPYPFVEKLIAHLRAAAAAGGEVPLPAIACPSCERPMENEAVESRQACPKCKERTFTMKPGSPVAHVEHGILLPPPG